MSDTRKHGLAAAHADGPGQRYQVALYDRDPNDVSRVVSAMLSDTLQRFPERARFAVGIPRPVIVYEPLTDTASTVAFRARGVTVYNDVAGRPSVVFPVANLTCGQVATAEPGPDPGVVSLFGASRWAIIRSAGIVGLLCHPLTAARFAALISEAG